MTETLIVGVADTTPPAAATTLKHQLEERLGVSVVVIVGCTSLATIRVDAP